MHQEVASSVGLKKIKCCLKKFKIKNESVDCEV